MLTDEQRKEFQTISKQMIKWLCHNCHPHVSVIIDCIHSELLEGIAVIHTEEYFKD